MVFGNCCFSHISIDDTVLIFQIKLCRRLKSCFRFNFYVEMILHAHVCIINIDNYMVNVFELKLREEICSYRADMAKFCFEKAPQTYQEIKTPI